MKAMLTTKIIILSARPKLSWGGGLLSNSPQAGLKMLSICSKGSSPGSRHLLQASRGHLRSSTAPLLRGGRTRGALGRTRGALISSLWQSSVHLAVGMETLQKAPRHHKMPYQIYPQKKGRGIELKTIGVYKSGISLYY